MAGAGDTRDTFDLEKVSQAVSEITATTDGIKSLGKGEKAVRKPCKELHRKLTEMTETVESPAGNILLGDVQAKMAEIKAFAKMLDDSDEDEAPWPEIKEQSRRIQIKADELISALVKTQEEEKKEYQAAQEENILLKAKCEQLEQDLADAYNKIKEITKQYEDARAQGRAIDGASKTSWFSTMQDFIGRGFQSVWGVVKEAAGMVASVCKVAVRKLFDMLKEAVMLAGRILFGAAFVVLGAIVGYIVGNLIGQLLGPWLGEKVGEFVASNVLSIVDPTVEQVESEIMSDGTFGGVVAGGIVGVVAGEVVGGVAGSVTDGADRGVVEGGVIGGVVGACYGGKIAVDVTEQIVRDGAVRVVKEVAGRPARVLVGKSPVTVEDGRKFGRACGEKYGGVIGGAAGAVVGAYGGLKLFFKVEELAKEAWEEGKRRGLIRF